MEVLCEMLNGVAQCVEEFGENSAVIQPGDVEAIFGIIHQQLQSFDKRRMDKEKVGKAKREFIGRKKLIKG